jgi:hypothetical protein
MIRWKSLFRTVLVVFAAILLSMVLTLACRALYLKRQAEHLRDDLAALVERQSSYEDVVRLADKYRRFRVPGEWSISGRHGFAIRKDEPCTAQRCEVILAEDAYELWLDPGFQRADAVCNLLKALDADLMRRYQVSSRVNLVRNDDPACAEPVERAGAAGV